MGQSVRRPEAPDTVEKLKINVNPKIPSVTLNWDPPLILETETRISDISRYHIRFKQSRGRHYEEAFVDGSTTSIVLTRESHLTTHTTFTFEVRAQSGDDVGQWKAVSAFVGLVPGEVQNLRSTLNTSVGSLFLEWDRPTNCETDQDLTAYDIRFRPSGSSDEEGYYKMTVKAQTRSILLTRELGLRPLMKYDLEVRAINASYDGNWSKLESIYIALTPDPIQKLTASVDSHKPSVTLKWDTPANAGYTGDVSTYEIRFWDEEKGCYNETTVNGSSTTAVITRETGLRPLTEISFEVRAHSGDDVCPEWRTVTTFVALNPDPVDNLKVHVDPSIPSVTLTWAPPQNSGVADSCSDVSRYHIRFKERGTRHYKEMIVDGSTTSLVLKKEAGLTPHTTFTFEVKAQSGKYVGQWKTVSAYVDLSPGEVQNLRSTLDTSTLSLTLDWDKPLNCETAKDVTAYDVWFKTCASSEKEGYCKTTVKASASHIHLTRESGLKPLMKHEFKVRAQNADHDGNWSRIEKYIALTPKPVQNLTASVDSHKPSVTLKWDAPVNAGCAGDVTTYEIHFWDKEKGCYNETTVNGSSTTAVITRETGLRPLTEISFEVRACSGDDDVSSEWRTVTTFVALNPDPVENLKGHVDPSIPSVTLTWAPPQNSGVASPDSCSDVSRYHIRFKERGTRHYKEMTVDGSTTSLVLKKEMGLTPHTTFIFEVKAQSGKHLGQWKTVSAFVALNPDPVENLKVHVDPSIPSVTLTWAPPQNSGVASPDLCSDVSRYRIRFKERGTRRYKKMTVDGSTTSLVLKRESGLTPHTTFIFEVKALSGKFRGQWKTVSAFVDVSPGEVQNLRSTLDTSTLSVTLDWDRPLNCQTAKDVTEYDVWFKTCASSEKEGYCKTTVKASAPHIHLTRASGLKPLMKHEFKIRAQNVGNDGNWRRLEKYIALTPKPVKNLTASVDSHKPSVTLKWDAPANAGFAGDVTSYEIRFWDKGCYKETTVNGFSTTAIITRETGLRPLTETSFQVRACSGDDVSPEWRTVTTFVALNPDPVENLKVHMDPSIPSVTLTWAPPQNSGVASPDSCSDVSRYHIRFKERGTRHYKEMTVDGSTTSLVLKKEMGLTPHTTFIFEVKAQSGKFLGQWKTVSAFVDVSPGEVQNLRSTLDTSTLSLTLDWDKPLNCETAKDVTAYDVWFKTCASSEKEGYCKTTVKASAPHIHLTRASGLRPLMKHEFKIRAQNSGHDGNWRRLEKYVALTPKPVKNLTASVDSHKPSVTLKWDAPANAGFAGDVTSYEIRFWDEEKGCYKETTVNGSSTTAIITRETGLRPLTETSFQVRAHSGDDVSPEWRTVTTFVALNPDPVENLKVHMDPSIPSVTLTWAPPQNSGVASPDSCSDVSRYHIRFKERGTQHYKEMTVDGSTTSLVLKKESWLTPHTTFIFEVKAQSGKYVGQWKTVSAFVGVFPGEVRNLRSTLDRSTGSLFLEWDRPTNCETDQDLTAYDIRFSPSGSLERKDYCMITVKATARNRLLTRESGLKPHKNYDLEVRARNTGYEGNWSGILQHIALIVQNLTAAADKQKPSVTLKWDPPRNGYPGDVTGYQVHFWDKERSSCNMVYVDGSSTTTVITRELGLRPLTLSTFEVRACNGDDVSQEGKTVSTFVALIPDPVQNLTAAVDARKPAVTLKWDPPANAGCTGDVTEYQVRFRGIRKEKDCYKKVVNGSSTTTVITRESGLRPLTTFTFEVRARSGDDVSKEWRNVSTFVAIVPDSVQNLKVSVNSKPSATLTWDPPHNVNAGDVRSYHIRFKPEERQHYNEVKVNGSTTRIVLRKKDGLSLHTTFTFEVRAQSGDDFGEWEVVSELIGGVMKLDSQSQEYMNLCDKFQKDWAVKKSPHPSIIAIIKIENSTLSLRFKYYPFKHYGIEQHYHGTALCCDLANSPNLCNDPECGACGITRSGFDPLRIGRSTWQRFGKGFYLAPNSSKAYDYAKGNRIGARRIATRNTRYNAIILCDVAPGIKFPTLFNNPNLDGPPEGCNSIHGKPGQDLNYDEIVVYNSHAICPKYIIFSQS